MHQNYPHTKKQPAHKSGAHTSGNVIHGQARFYDRVVALLTLGQEKKLRRETVKKAGVQPGDSVLEVGCGTASLAIAAQEQVGAAGRVAGIDPSPEMIAIAKEKAARAGLDIDLRIGVIESLPYPDNSFDAVLGSLIIHHLPDELKWTGLAEVQRVLKPGGRLGIVEFDPTRWSLITLRHGGPRRGHSFEAAHLVKLLQAVGFHEAGVSRMSSRSLFYVSGVKTKEPAQA